MSIARERRCFAVKKKKRESKEHRKSNARYFFSAEKGLRTPTSNVFLSLFSLLSLCLIFFVIRRWFRETKWEATEKNNWKENLN